MAIFQVKPSIESAVASFNKALDDLKAVAEIETAEAARQDNIVNIAIQAKADAEAKVAKANSIADKLRNLIGD